MQSFELEIPNTKAKNDLTIIYEEEKDNFHKITTSKEDFLRTLHYFEKKSNEINQTEIVYIQEDIKFDIFNDFISSIEKKKILINEDNYRDYYYLSSKYEYNELKKQIEKFIISRPDIISIADLISKSLPSNNKNDENIEPIDLEKEEIFAKNLDICITNGCLKKLPLSMLIRILNSPKRQLKDHHLLYLFVKDIIVEKGKLDLKEEEKDNLFILPSCFDYCLMNSNEIEELFEVEKSMPFFSPRHSDEKIKSFISIEKELFQKYSEIESKMKEIEQNYNSRLEKLENISQTQEEQILNGKTKFELFQKEFASNQTQIDKKFTEIQTIQKEITEASENKNKILFERIEKLEKSDETSKLKIKSAAEEIGKNNLAIKTNENSIIELRKQIEDKEKKYNEVKSANENITKELDKTKDKISMISYQSHFPVNDPKVKACPNGIFQYCFNKCNGNPVNNGLIEIDGNSSDTNIEKLLPNLIDASWTSFWFSKNNENSYIKIDFKNFLVEIHKYRIRAGRSDGEALFNSWILTGTTENNEEVFLDEVNNSAKITKNHPEASFLTQNNSIVRSITLTMKGKSISNDYVMRMRNIELFGYLKSDL